MNAQGERVVDEYLQRLERALSDVPSARREEIIAEIASHINEALAEEPDDSEASVRNVLDRVGDPEDIAAEARDRLDIREPRTSWTDPLAIVLLLVGGFLWLIGWVAGVVLLWLSDVWSTRQKLIGTLVVPGGLLAAFMFVTMPARYTSTSCTTSTVNGIETSVCQSVGDSAGIFGQGLALVVFILLIVGPIATSVYLGRTLMRARRR
jgi:uncharacterized membrane protein